VCVVDARGRALACPQGVPAAAALAPSPSASASGEAEATPSWRLFLRSDFGADDWVLLHGGAAADSSVATQAIARTMVLGVVAAMLVVALLSMGQVRRTMVPLERLIAGTRRLSRGEFTARVEHAQADEFGELAHSFNHMAERIGQQVEAMHVQSAIDLEILNGLDVERILHRVAERLSVLVPSARACVVELDRAVPALARAHRSDGTVAVLASPPAEALDACARESLLHWDVQPDWLQRAMTPWHGSVKVHGVHVGGRAIAVLVLGVSDERLDNVETRREIIELGDRVAVALTSAERERRLQERATRDSLTGLANRLGLFEHIEQRLNEAARGPFSLLFVDLDGFKHVNDAHGHATGDALLSAIAQRLSTLTAPGSIVARPGGDEFVLVVPGSCDDGAALAAKVIEQLGLPVALPNRVVTVACSIGMAHHPEDGHTVSDLMRRADMAMYAAKSAGGRRSAWFDAAMDARLAERTAVLADLHLALERNEFELHYQPRVAAEGGAVRCAEALLRWRRRGGEIVPPGRFVDLLEDSGLIDAAGLWVIGEACRQLVAWRASGTALESLSVNVSTRQLHAPGFAEQVLGIVRGHGLAPSDIELEITESVFIGDSSEAIARLRTLRDAGMGIALDDFGTGYSSLSYLHMLPITCLKVDRSFVSALGERDSALALTRTIVALAGALNLQVVAEGVETPAQAKLLRELGCHRLQGFLYARGLIADDFARYCAQPPSARARALFTA
jgi:diguanylate cyclase (GGDEF)-like protein